MGAYAAPVTATLWLPIISRAESGHELGSEQLSEWLYPLISAKWKRLPSIPRTKTFGKAEKKHLAEGKFRFSLEIFLDVIFGRLRTNYEVDF